MFWPIHGQGGQDGIRTRTTFRDRDVHYPIVLPDHKARREGLEPPPSRFGDDCSSIVSYRRVLVRMSTLTGCPGLSVLP